MTRREVVGALTSAALLAICTGGICWAPTVWEKVVWALDAALFLLLFDRFATPLLAARFPPAHPGPELPSLLEDEDEADPENGEESS